MKRGNDEKMIIKLSKTSDHVKKHSYCLKIIHNLNETKISTFLKNINKIVGSNNWVNDLLINNLLRFIQCIVRSFRVPKKQS